MKGKCFFSSPAFFQNMTAKYFAIFRVWNGFMTKLSFTNIWILTFSIFSTECTEVLNRCSLEAARVKIFRGSSQVESDIHRVGSSRVIENFQYRVMSRVESNTKQIESGRVKSDTSLETPEDLSPNDIAVVSVTYVPCLSTFS